jgi:hypothetical protein
MADSAAFDHACDMLEAETSLERLEARGTVRIALKEAGLNAKSVSPDQLAVVVEKLLPRELISRGVTDPNGACARLCEMLGGLEAPDAGDAPESLFVRMGAA